MSVEAYLDLGETNERIELFDGSLYLSARGHPRHQFIVGRIMDALRAGAAASDWHLLGRVNLRLGLQRIANPDMIMTRAINLDDQLVDACAAVLVAEVTSRSDEVSRVLKRHYYAAAGIPWYLLVEQESATLHLYQLRGDYYVERSVTRPGEVLHLEEPVTADLVPEDLLSPN
ncbi:Uma2 family endonuclease [Actinoplanes sp. NPDC004185]